VKNVKTTFLAVIGWTLGTSKAATRSIALQIAQAFAE
jgi:hypothetical protein